MLFKYAFPFICLHLYVSYLYSDTEFEDSFISFILVCGFIIYLFILLKYNWHNLKFPRNILWIEVYIQLSQHKNLVSLINIKLFDFHGLTFKYGSIKMQVMPTFSPSSFTILGITFQSLINLELTFMQGDNYR